jgi:hypothetical protein
LSSVENPDHGSGKNCPFPLRIYSAGVSVKCFPCCAAEFSDESSEKFHPSSGLLSSFRLPYHAAILLLVCL